MATHTAVKYVTFGNFQQKLLDNCEYSSMRELNI